MHACPRGKSDKHFEAKPLPFSSNQVGYSGLTDTENFRGINLCKVFGFNELAELDHKIGAHLENIQDQ